MNKRIINSVAGILLSLSLTACGLMVFGNPAFDDPKFTNWFSDLLEVTNELPDDQKVKLTDEFVTLMAQGYRGEITIEQAEQQLKRLHPGQDAYINASLKALQQR